MNEDRIKVIYIAGPTRSGSTVLSNILGELDGFFNAGELVDIWDKGLASNGSCGCGKQMNKCEIWSAILTKAFRDKNIDIQEMIRLRDSAVRTQRIPVPRLMLIPKIKSRLEFRLGKYLTNLEDLYRTIPSITHSKVIIDASKNPWYAHILAMIPAIDLYIVHLIRDPRAIVYSWLRKKEGLRQINPVRSSLMWSIWNVTTEMLWRDSPGKYLKLCYEDFVAQPREAVKRILDLAQAGAVDLPFLTEYEIRLGANHTVYGNPNRFETGILRLRPDEEWKRMKKPLKILVNVLTWPLLIRYGYRVVP